MIKDIEGVISRITSEIKKFTDIAVIGMSGGADSTLVSILCKLALGEKNVYAVHMPYNFLDIKTFNARSKLIADYLNLESLDICIGEISDSIELAIAWQLKMTLSIMNSGNARARSRMCVLYAIGHHLGESLGKRVRVMNTCNLSESILGYETKFGDGGGDLASIGDLFKSEVYQLLDYFRDQGMITEEMIDRIPSAGLYDNQTDFGEIGYTYDEMEPSMRYLLGYFPVNQESEVFKFVAKKYEESEHKRKVAPPLIDLRDLCDDKDLFEGK